MGFPGSSRWFVALAGAVLLVTASSPSAAALRAGGGPWVRPVDGAVVRPFTPGMARYGPGHRGVDLAAAPGAPVRAADAGTVSFAGPVAGSLHVVVSHEGGVRTSYSFLARVDVRRGQKVARGQMVGLAGGTGPGHDVGVLHLGLRVGEVYVDPMRLFAPADLTRLIRLAPVDVPSQKGLAPRAVEARSLAEGLHLPTGVDRMLHPPAPGLLEQATGAVGEALHTAVGIGGALVEPWLAPARWVAGRTPLGALAVDARRAGARLLAWAASRTDCTSATRAAPGGGGSGHSVVAIAGIDSATDPRTGATFRLDTDVLGYRSDEVHWFSYAADGGRYAAPDTWGDLVRAALRLRDQLRARQHAEPGREVDLVAHSQGGVVVDAFLQFVYDPADPTLPPIGTVVTLSSPHQGAPLASVAQWLRTSRSGRDLLARIRGGTGAAVPSASSDAVGQLAEGSNLTRSLWVHRLPDHVDFTTVSAADDVVVPADRTGVPGADSVTVDPDGLGDHSGIVRDPAAMVATRLALEGRRPPCIGWTEGVRGAVEPVLITRIEHTGGSLLAEGARAVDVLRSR